MMFAKSTVLMALVVLGASGCDTGGGKSGETITEAQCHTVVAKGFELQGMPKSASDEMARDAAKGCAMANAIKTTDHECAVAASTLAEYEACDIVFDLR